MQVLDSGLERCLSKYFNKPSHFQSFSSVWSLSRVRLFVTPRTAAHQASLSITNSQSLLKLRSIESVMPSNCLMLCCPLLLLSSILPSIRVFSSESVLRNRWPKYWSFSFSMSPSNEYSGLIFSRIDWFDLLAVHGTLQESSPAPQFGSISSSALSLLYDLTLTSIDNYWKNHSFDYMDFRHQETKQDFKQRITLLGFLRGWIRRGGRGLL